MTHRADYTAAVERDEPAISHAELTRRLQDAAPTWAAVALHNLRARTIDGRPR